MNELVGIRWGNLKEETKELLLKNANCTDGETDKEIKNGECIVDLNKNLSVAGKVVDFEIIIDDEAIIYNPADGIVLGNNKELKLEINEVMTFAEATEKWGLADSTLRKLAKTNKLLEGIDFRKSSKVWLITRKAMERVYGKL